MRLAVVRALLRVVSSFAEAQVPLLLPDTAKMGQRLEILQPDAALRSALRRPVCSLNPLPCCAQHISVQLYFRALLNCCIEAAQQVVCLAAARPRHAIGSHGIDEQSAKQMSNDRNTRIENLVSRLPISFNMGQYARRSSTPYDNIAVFADFVTSAGNRRHVPWTRRWPSTEAKRRHPSAVPADRAAAPRDGTHLICYMRCSVVLQHGWIVV